MIKSIGKALESFGEGLMTKSATMFKGAKYTSPDITKAGRIGGTMTARGRAYQGAGRLAMAAGKRPYLTTGVVAGAGISAGVYGRSSGVNGLQGRSSGANGLSGRSSGGY